MSGIYFEWEWTQKNNLKSFNKRFKKKWLHTVLYNNGTWKTFSHDGNNSSGTYQKYSDRKRLIIHLKNRKNVSIKQRNYFIEGTFVMPSKKIMLKKKKLFKWTGCQIPLGFVDGYIRGISGTTYTRKNR